VLAPALPVALAGDGRVAASWSSDAARGQDEVDGAEHVDHSVRVLLDAAGVQQEAGLRRAPPLGGLPDRALGDAGDLRGATRRPLPDAAAPAG